MDIFLIPVKYVPCRTYDIRFFMWRKCVADIKFQTTMLSMEKLNKGVIWYHQLSRYRKLAAVKSFKADVSSVTPSSEEKIGQSAWSAETLLTKAPVVFPT